MIDQLYLERPGWRPNTGCYFNQIENITGDYYDFDQENIFEMVLWQHMFPAGYVDPAPEYNLTLDHNITELYGAYTLAKDDRGVYWELQQWGGKGDWTHPMTAVGVRCTSSAAVGTARVDGARSTYTDFTRTDTPISNQTHRYANRFTANAIGGVTGITYKLEWYNFLGDLFNSVAGPPELYAAFNTDPGDAGTGTMLRLSYFQGDDLRKSILRAYAAYAVHLMYGGDKGFTSLSGSHTTLVNPNVTAFLPGRVLKYGEIPVFVPMTLLVAWSLSSAMLSALYGFRPRWSDTLDEGIRALGDKCKHET